jgi:hypothetical protein
MTNRAAIPNPALHPLAALIGDWHTTGKHPAVPEKTLHGKASFEWIEGGAFLLMHSQLDDDRFPNGIAIVGSDSAQGSLFMLYFDERGVSRKYDFAFGDQTWSWWREAKDLSQRFKCTITDEGRTMVGRGEMSKDDGPWEKDLDLTYRRVP